MNFVFTMLSVNFFHITIIILSFPHLSSPIIHRSHRIVKVSSGDLQGFIVEPKHRSLGKVEVFLGVPYAAAPVGSLRFMPPVQPFKWPSIKRAERMPPVCPQKYPDISSRRDALKRMPEGRYNYLQRLIPMLRNQSEDCLYLNIYVPVRKKAVTDKLPVLVYIHGESYEWNSGNPYDGSTLASYGQVIVITINFRLGILGFLRPALSVSQVSNFGLLDQTAALFWVKENIEAFGGDPEKVTIFGHGTGAALANLLLISTVTQVSEGLFQRAILMSGSALSKWALTWDPEKYTIQVAKAVGCPLNSRRGEMAQCLKSKSVEQLLNVRLQTPPFTTPLGPIVDNLIIKSEPLRSMSVDSSNFGRYELLYGVTPSESYNMLNALESKSGMTTERKNRLLRAYVSNNFDHHASHIYSAILNEYDNYKSSKLPDERQIRDQTLEILSDAQIVAPVVNMGNLHSELNTRNYFYVFNHQSNYGDYPTAQGAVHGEELAYVFGAPLVGGFSHFTLNYTLEEVFLSEFVMTLWTNFAKTGNPNLPTPQHFVTPGVTPDWEANLRTLWPPYDKITQQYIDLDMHVLKNSYYRAKKLGFWNRLIPDLVSSSGTIRDPVAPDHYPGLPHRTITLMPTVKPGYTHHYTPVRHTTPPTASEPVFPEGPKPIKPVQQFPGKSNQMPSFESSDNSNEPAVEQSKKEEVEESAVAGVPYTVLIIVGVVILCINCVAMAVMYYQRDKLVKQAQQMKDEAEVSENSKSEESHNDTKRAASNDNSEADKRSRKKTRSSTREEQRSNSGSTSRPTSLSRESSRRRKMSTQSQDHGIASEKSTDQKHKRSKSDHSIYVEIEKDKKKEPESEVKPDDAASNKQQSVTFNTGSGLPPKSSTRSTSSITSKSSIRSSSSKVSVKSISSKSSSVKPVSNFKPLRKNASCQSLPTSDYGWSVTKECTDVDEKIDKSGKGKPEAISTIQKRSCPKGLHAKPETDGCATLPRMKPPPPPRSTSLTARDIQELEKLHEDYRKTRPLRLTSTESGDMSGSEPFYSMGGGEAPARAPGLMYGPTVPSANTLLRSSLKADANEYDQFQKYPHQCSSIQSSPTTSAEPPFHLNPVKGYMTYGENRGPRGPLASFGKPKDQFPAQYDYGMGRLNNVSPTMPPPIPAHQIPLTPSILKSTNPLVFHHPPPIHNQSNNKSSFQMTPIPTTAIFDQTENTGTVRRQKSRPSGSSPDALDKPLKGVLKTTSAYDKPKGGNVGNPLHVGIIPPTIRSDSSPQSTPSTPSNVSSPAPSVSSSGMPSPSELKSILVKRTPRGAESTVKQKHENNAGGTGS